MLRCGEEALAPNLPRQQTLCFWKGPGIQVLVVPWSFGSMLWRHLGSRYYLKTSISPLHSFTAWFTLALLSLKSNLVWLRARLGQFGLFFWLQNLNKDFSFMSNWVSLPLDFPCSKPLSLVNKIFLYYLSDHGLPQLKNTFMPNWIPLSSE